MAQMYPVPGPMTAHPPVVAPAPAPQRRPGLGASLTAWACQAVAWVSYLVALFFGVWALGAALAEDDAASTYGFTALGAYLAAGVATIAGIVGLCVSFVRRRNAGELRRSGPVADLVVLAVVSAISAISVLWPLLWFVAR